VQITLPTTGSFCCFALSTRVANDFVAPIKLNDRIYATSKPPFYIDEWWQKQLGEIEIGQITRCNLFLLALAEDTTKTVQDLNNELNSYYFSLLFEGVAYSKRGIILGGDNESIGLRVNSIGWLPDFYAPFDVVPPEVTKEHFEYTTQLVPGIDTIFGSAANEYLRLRKGFNSLLNGIKQLEVHNRLHQSVRAIEGVIKPRQGDGTRKFKYRCQFFTGRKPKDVNLLEELYELRCAAEHLNPMANKLTSYPAHQRDPIKALRSFQVEILASFIYRKILSDSNLLSRFVDDDAIDRLWACRDKELSNIWGRTVNLNLSKTPLPPRLPEWD
jgi:hypothetical protein